MPSSKRLQQLSSNFGCRTPDVHERVPRSVALKSLSRVRPNRSRIFSISKTLTALLAVLWVGQAMAGADECQQAVSVVSHIVGGLERIPPGIQFDCYDVRRIENCRYHIELSRRQVSNATDLLKYFRTKCGASSLAEVQKMYATLPTYDKRISTIRKLLDEAEAKR